MSRGWRSRTWSTKPTAKVEIDWGHPVTQGLQVVLPFTESNGATVFDVRTQLRGTLLNSPLWVTGDQNRGIRFTNTSDQYIQFLDSSGLMLFKGSQTIFCRFFYNGGGGTRLIVRPGDDTTGGNVNYALSRNGSNQLTFFAVNSNEVNSYNVASTNTILTDWNTAFGILDIAGNIQVVLNGTRTVGDSTNGISRYQINFRTYISRWNNTFQQNWTGDIDVIYMWNRVLTPAEIRYLTESPYGILTAPAPRIHYFFIPAVTSQVMNTQVRLTPDTKMTLQRDSKLIFSAN